MVAVASAVLFLILTVGAKGGAYVTYTVLTQSMEPAIPEGSVVIVVPIAPDQLRVGDVITFSSGTPPYATLTHRVVSIDREGDAFLLHTKGDANLLVDPWTLSYSQQAGIVRVTVPLAGYVIAATSANGVRLALGVIFVALIAAFWLLGVGMGPGLPAEQAAPSKRQISLGQLSLVRAGILAWLAVSLLAGRKVWR